MSVPILSNTHYDSLIQAAAASFGIDPALLKAHVNRESQFNPNAKTWEPNVSDYSLGLAQVRLQVAHDLGYPGDLNGLLGESNAGTNLYLAAKLIRRNLDYAKGDALAAISAYNAGFGDPPNPAGRTDAAGNFINQPYVDDVYNAWLAYAPDFAEPAPAPDPTTGAVPDARTGGFSTTALIALGVLALAALLAYFAGRH